MLRISLVFLLFGGALAAACGPKAKPVEHAKRPQNKGTAAGPTRGSTAGVWRVLVTPNARWVLENSLDDPGHRATLTGETLDIRRVGAADVARIKWTLTSDSGPSPFASAIPTQVAVTASGAWFLTDDMDDAAVAKALQSPPTWPDPPVAIPEETRQDGVYLRVAGQGSEPIVCVGEGPGPNAGECEDVCFGEMCVAPQGGVVSISGTWAPNYEIYEQPAYKQ